MNSMTGDVEVRRRDGRANYEQPEAFVSSRHRMDDDDDEIEVFLPAGQHARVNARHASPGCGLRSRALSRSLSCVQVGCHGAKRPGDAGRSRRKLMAVVLLAAGVLVLVPAAMGFTQSRFPVHISCHLVGLAENLAWSLLTPLCDLLQHGRQRCACIVAFAWQRQICSKQHRQICSKQHSTAVSRC